MRLLTLADCVLPEQPAERLFKIVTKLITITSKISWSLQLN